MKKSTDRSQTSPAVAPAKSSTPDAPVKTPDVTTGAETAPAIAANPQPSTDAAAGDKGMEGSANKEAVSNSTVKPPPAGSNIIDPETKPDNVQTDPKSGLMEAAKDSTEENNPAPQSTPELQPPPVTEAKVQGPDGGMIQAPVEAVEIKVSHFTEQMKLRPDAEKYIKTRLQGLDQAISEAPTMDVRNPLEAIQKELIVLLE